MIYLDNAATTYPKPESVYDAVSDCMRNYCANPGRAGHKLAMRAAREIYDARENIAKLFNIDNPMSIVFTSNATDSLNLAIKGTVSSGDHIITTSMEHNSVIRPIKALESYGVENTIVNCNEDGFLSIEDLKVGMKLQGTVRNVIDFGAFVDIGVKQDGLVHISKLSDRFVKHPSEVVAVGDIVQVWITSVDTQKGRIGLSMLASDGHE